MANCLNCGKELPSFSIGEQPSLCPDCKRQLHTAPITDPALPQPQPQAVRRLGMFQMASLFPITSVIVAINVAVYVGCALYSQVTHQGSPMEFSISMLLRWGADFGPLTLDGQWWRIFTSMWLHGGLIHVGANMYCFWDFGRIAERVYGRGRYLSIYLLTGLASSIASLAIHPATVSVGASGAIFGVAGALVFPFYRKRLHLPPPVMKSMLRSLGSFIAINLVIGSIVPVIDNSAHVGGLLAGLALGGLWSALATKPIDMKAMVWKVTAATLIVLAAAFIGVRRLHENTVLALQSVFASERGDLKTAEQKAQQAVARRPNDYVSHLALGDVYFKKQQFADAVRAYQAALQLKPNDPYTQSQIGAAYVALNKWKEAETPLREALKEDPNDADTLLNLGIALAGMDRYDEGLYMVRKSVQSNPSSARGQFTYGSLLAEKGEYKQALGPLGEAVKLDPKDDDYKQALQRVESQVKQDQ